MYKIILADDHEIFRLGLKTIINKMTSISIVGEAENGNKLISLLQTVDCDLILLDLSMPELNGFNVLKIINEQYPDIKCLILSMHFDEVKIKKALTYNIAGYIHKEDIADSIPRAIKEVRSGRKFFSDNIQQFILSNYKELSDKSNLLQQLTNREKQVAELVVQGMTNQEISDVLNISSHTVQFHRSNTLKKLKVKSTVDLVKMMVGAES